MRIRSTIIELETRLPFVTAHGGGSRFRNVLVELEHQGTIGLGEAAPARYHGETADTVVAALSVLAPAAQSVGDPAKLEAIHAAMDAALAGHGAAKAAIDIACHDWLGKRCGLSIAALLGLDPAASPPTSFTIPIGPPASVPEAVASGAAFRILKVKLGDPGDRERLERVRAATPKLLRADANGGWAPATAVARLAELEAAGIELLEQPVPARDVAGLRHVRRAARIPIVADEPAVVAADVPALAGAVDGVNVKLMKAGGIRPALAMIQVARAHGMRVMLGCMVESSIGIAAAAALAALADWVDLDGHLLLARDPARGLGFVDGVVRPPAAAGLGVALTEDVFAPGFVARAPVRS
jgi:L-alanine-DL-glutamate epimerase-like enolase superfamily enzyme